MEDTQQVDYKQDDQYSSQPYTRASAVSPASMAVVSASATEQQQQNQNEY
jgi:hypothetical protein